MLRCPKAGVGGKEIPSASLVGSLAGSRNPLNPRADKQEKNIQMLLI